MKAHFIASTGELATDMDNYVLIINALKQNKVELTDGWLDKAYKRVRDGQEVPRDDWRTIYRQNLDAISRADVILAEVSKSSFLVGFQVATALQMKKPILLLSTHLEAPGAKGVSQDEEIIKFAQYDKDDVQTVISTFIEENRTGGKDIRFNFFIDRKILNWLNWASFQTGETKSEIIRKLVEKEIEKSEKPSA